MTDDELAEALAPGDPRRHELVAKLAPARRAALEHMIWTADELNAGRVPAGVIVCRGGGRHA